MEENVVQKYFVIFTMLIILVAASAFGNNYNAILQKHNAQRNTINQFVNNYGNIAKRFTTKDCTGGINNLFANLGNFDQNVINRIQTDVNNLNNRIRNEQNAINRMPNTVQRQVQDRVTRTVPRTVKEQVYDSYSCSYKTVTKTVFETVTETVTRTVTETNTDKKRRQNDLVPVVGNRDELQRQIDDLNKRRIVQDRVFNKCQQYFPRSERTIQTCLGKIGPDTTARKEFVEECKKLHEFFLVDVGGQDPFRFDLDTYDRDINLACDRVIDRKKERETINRDRGGSKDFRALFGTPGLDEGFRALVPRKISLDVDRTGLDNRFAAHSLERILVRFQEKFNDANLNDSINFFLDQFPQGGENLAMDAFTPIADLDGSDSISSKSKTKFENDRNRVNESFVFDETGRFVTSENSSGNPLQSIPTESTTDLIFNTRSFGGGNFSGQSFSTINLVIDVRDSNNQLVTKRFQLQDKLFTSPIVLDMDGDGKLQASNGNWHPHDYTGAKVAVFDINGDGFDEVTEWVGPKDGLLLIHEEGKTINGRTLFGDADGFTHGFEKLKAYDANNDGQLAGEELNILSIWLDKNGNAQPEAGEITAVKDLGITSIKVTHEGFASSFERNGKTQKMWDWYPTFFRVKKVRE